MRVRLVAASPSFAIASLCILALSAGCGGDGGASPKRFVHADHFVVMGSHAGFACDRCHEPSAPSFALSAGGMDCLHCHAQADVTPAHAAVSGFAYGNDSCVPCHKGGTAAVDHALFFPIAPGATHEKLACAACHGPTKAVTDLQCATCHGHHDQPAMDAAHAGLPNYAFASPACYGCHKDGGIPSFDHPFPIDAASPHRGIGCATCHGPTRAKADLQCTACHDHDRASTDAAHVGIANYAYSSPSCYDCHTDGRAGLPANHDAALFPVTGTKHATVGCSACHGATKKVADVTCVPCHAQPAMATKHAAIRAATGRLDRITYASYAWATASCLRCHADGQVNRIASHPSVRHGLTGEGHGPFCLACHRTSRGDKAWAADFKAYSCLACHTDNNGGGGG